MFLFVCLFLFDWAGWVFAAISWCGSAVLSQRTATTPRTSCPIAQNLCQISYCCVLQSRGFLFKWSRRQIAFCRQTQSWYTVPILVPKRQIFKLPETELLSSQATKIAGCQPKRKTLQSQTISGKVQGLFTYVTFIILHFLITWLLMNSRRLLSWGVT